MLIIRFGLSTATLERHDTKTLKHYKIQNKTFIYLNISTFRSKSLTILQNNIFVANGSSMKLCEFIASSGCINS